MPIKSCTRCGLKVLVDAQAAATDNFLCTRCAPEAAAASAPKPSGGGGKRPSVKVTCPYCGASFSGSKPSRPAKGGCPVCQKELVLLPDGTIQAAATFNLSSWQKEKKSASNPPPAPAMDAPVEMPSAPDPLGGSTILDMGGPPGGAPPEPPSLDDPTMALPGAGYGGETMLGMGSGGAPAPAPSIDEPEAPPPPPEREEIPEEPPDLGGATILDMGPRPVETPPPDIEERSPKPDLLSETMPGMDRPPSAESPVAPPTPPPIPDEIPEPVAEDVTEGPTVRDVEPEPYPSRQEEAEAASLESAPEIPADLGGQTILGMGGADDLEPPAPSIEEPPPEAVPILAKDVGAPEPEAAPPPEATEMAPGQATPKPYVYQPIARVPRKPPPVRGEPLPAAPPSSPRIAAASEAPAPPPPSTSSAPVLGSDFRIAAAPPPPKPVERAREEKKPAGPKTTAVVLPRAMHSVGKMVLAWALLALPVVAGFALHSMQKSGSAEKVIQGVTKQVQPGLDKMRSEIEKAVKKQPEAPPESK
jgi:hypothetical protein